MKRFTKAQGYREEDLLQYGFDHLKSAKILFETSPVCYDSAAYLAHLGIELILKAVHLFYDGEFKNEHKLSKLYKYLRKNYGFSIDAKDEGYLEKLDKCNNEVRYPPEDCSYVAELESDDWRKIESLLKALYCQMPKALLQKTQDLNYAIKGRRVLMRRPKNYKK